MMEHSNKVIVLEDGVSCWATVMEPLSAPSMVDWGKSWSRFTRRSLLLQALQRAVELEIQNVVLATDATMVVEAGTSSEFVRVQSQYEIVFQLVSRFWWPKIWYWLLHNGVY